jgi:hypothetical protein
MKERKVMEKLLNKEDTIKKTLLTALLFEGFWERWKSHGISAASIYANRNQLKNIENWVSIWEKQALEHEQAAQLLLEKNVYSEAENGFRTAGLYYNLIQWILPEREAAKLSWYQRCLDCFRKADALSPVETKYVSFPLDGSKCMGRVRIPESPVGCIIIMNPLDSSKEELFTYERDFLEGRFATISFDGPGQGETYVSRGLQGSKQRWTAFTERCIDYAAGVFPELNLYLFGTSSGAAWAIYGSGNPKVCKTAAVSPAISNQEIQLPDYFIERLGYVSEQGEDILPEFQSLSYLRPVLVFHGNKDVMVPNKEIHNLYSLLPQGKEIIEYEEEGHCCNNKLVEVRKFTMDWYLEQ